MSSKFRQGELVYPIIDLNQIKKYWIYDKENDTYYLGKGNKNIHITSRAYSLLKYRFPILTIKDMVKVEKNEEVFNSLEIEYYSVEEDEFEVFPDWLFSNRSYTDFKAERLSFVVKSIDNSINLYCDKNCLYTKDNCVSYILFKVRKLIDQ